MIPGQIGGAPPFEANSAYSPSCSIRISGTFRTLPVCRPTVVMMMIGRPVSARVFPVGDVSCSQVLAIAVALEPADRGRTKDFDDATLSAAVLHVRPAGFVDGGEVEAVAGGDVVDLAVVERFGAVGSGW